MERRRKILTQKTIEHQRNVTSAAYTYYNLGCMNIRGIANCFHVNENVISDWLCEAIAKRYIPSDEMCKHIMYKHISEYETRHYLSQSQLRENYKKAFAARSTVPATITFDSLTGVETV